MLKSKTNRQLIPRTWKELTLIMRMMEQFENKRSVTHVLAQEPEQSFSTPTSHYIFSPEKQGLATVSVPMENVKPFYILKKIVFTWNK